MLTPEEKAELEALRNEFKPAPAAAATSGLSPEEKAELEALRGEFGGIRQPSQFPVSTLGQDQGVINEGQPIQETPPRSFGQEVLDRAQTQLESFGNTVSMGYLPQLQAAFEKINPDPSGGLDDKLRAEGFTLPDQGYVSLRDENIKRQQAQEARNPYDAVAGMIGGMVTSTPVLGAAGRLVNGASKATGGIARLKDSARVGASLSAVANPGDVEGVLSPLQATERLTNTAKGGAIGIAGQGVGEIANSSSNAIKGAPALLDKVGNITAVKAIGAIGKDFKKLFRKGGTSHEIGDTLLQNNIVQAGDTLEDIARKALEAKNMSGQKIGSIYKQVSETVKDTESMAKLSPKAKKLLDITALDGSKIADKSLNRINKNLVNELDAPEIKARVVKVLDELRAKGPDIDIQDLQQMKSNLDNSINYDKALSDLPKVQKELKVVRDMISKQIQDRVRVLGKITGKKDLLGQLKAENKNYSHFSKAEAISSNRAREVEGHKWLSLSENLAGGTGATIGAMTGDSPEDRFKNAIIGFAAGASAKKADKFLTPAIANSAKRLSVIMKKPANFAKYTEPLMEAAKKSPEEFQAFINQLGKDPEFTRIVKPQGAR